MRTQSAMDIFTYDLSDNIYDHLPSDALIRFSRSSQEAYRRVIKYAANKINAFEQSNFLKLCRTGNMPSIHHAKRALVLATCFTQLTPSNFLPTLLVCYPHIEDCILESREVTTQIQTQHAPYTKQQFPCIWHFKLPHLIAFCGSTSTYLELRKHLMLKSDMEMEDDNYTEDARASFLNFRLNDFFNQPIEWQDENTCGQRGPTPLLIALLFNHNDDFIKEYSTNGQLVPVLNFDLPFAAINPLYIALQRGGKKNNSDLFTIMSDERLYSSPYTLPRLQKSLVAIVITQAALSKDHSLLDLLNQSIDGRNLFKLHLWDLFMSAAKTNNLLVCQFFIYKEIDLQRHHTFPLIPLLYAVTEEACVNSAYLPLLKLFLCGGINPIHHCAALSPQKLVDHHSHISFKRITFFNNDDHNQVKMLVHNNKKNIRCYFDIAKHFHTMVNLIYLRKNSPRAIKGNPVTCLVKAAALDKDFFNEMIVSFLENKQGLITNKSFCFDNAIFQYYNCLYEFAAKHHGNKYLNVETLEIIRDSISRHCETSQELHQSENLLELAYYFYFEAKIKRNEEHHQLPRP